MSAPAPPARPAPGGGFVTPPLGAPDAIEPPSRDIVPGMLIRVAKEKGAKPQSVSYLLSWRPDTELWINKELEVVQYLQVEYPAKDWEVVSAKWGKGTFDDVWIGANWMAKLNGCASGSCSVTFVRSPITFLEKTPVPPGALGNARAGMTPAQVKAATGYAISEGAGSSNGFGWDVSVDYSGGELEELSLDVQNIPEGFWEPQLVKLWGPLTELGSNKVWVNAKDGWLVQYGWAGTLLRFRPMKPLIRTIAKGEPDSVLMLAHKLLGQPKSALASVPSWDAKRERFRTMPNEFSLGSAPSIDVDTNDKDVISEVSITFYLDNENDAERDKVLKLVSAAWGPITTAKDDSGNESKTIAVEGLKAKVEGDGSVRLTLTN